MLLGVVEEIIVNSLVWCVISLFNSNVAMIALIRRLSKESSNDAQPNVIDCLELIEAVSDILKQFCKYICV